MLIFKLKHGERVLIGDVVVTVLSKFRLGFEGEQETKIYREKIAVKLGLLPANKDKGETPNDDRAATKGANRDANRSGAQDEFLEAMAKIIRERRKRDVQRGSRSVSDR